ncbi:MAG: TerB family tellurite resistance protein [Chitinophagaceae bacterium]|nr:MAG: TerB family tellurite resistance protein [Chitinophagaceae bacterium]
METSVKILNGISDEEKGAYLSAIASIATADTEASETEIDHLTHLCEAADLSETQQQRVLQAAQSTSEQDLAESLDVLKSSDLKYSLLTDLFAFAKSDGNYSEAEQQHVHQIATYLGIDDTQYGLLGELAEKTNESNANGAGMDHPQVQSAFGLGDKLNASGINAGSLIKGLISIAAPLIISKMMRKGSSASPGASGGGGLLGGGGLGSLIGMLSGGKGMGGLGGMLGKMFR